MALQAEIKARGCGLPGRSFSTPLPGTDLHRLAPPGWAAIKEAAKSAAASAMRPDRSGGCSLLASFATQASCVFSAWAAAVVSGRWAATSPVRSEAQQIAVRDQSSCACDRR